MKKKGCFKSFFVSLNDEEREVLMLKHFGVNYKKKKKNLKDLYSLFKYDTT